MSRLQSSGIGDEANCIVKNYELKKVIGQGTYGKVRLGTNLKTNEQIKSDKQIARLQREIRFLKLLHHPNIVQVLDVIETDDYIYIIMEYAVGGELFDYIVANKRVKESEARSFFRMVLSAIDYCHQNAIIHRDLKPENLLLDDKKNIKIIDFGFGNNYRSNELLDTFCGSPFYAAPEMILGRKYIGPEVDMWSLGVILFALLCGHLPFDDENMQELYKKIAGGKYNAPKHLKDDAKHLIQRLITVDPKKRATLEEVMNHKWVNEGYSGPPTNHVPARPTHLFHSDLKPDIIRRLQIFGYRKDDIREAFSSQDQSSPHPIRATYYLLEEMLIRQSVFWDNKKPIAKPFSVRDSAQTIGPETEQTSDSDIDKDKSTNKNIALSADTVQVGRPTVGIEIGHTQRAVSAFTMPHTDPQMLANSIQRLSLDQKVPNFNPRRQSNPLPIMIPNTHSKPQSAADKIKEELRAVSGWFLNHTTTTNKTMEQVRDFVKTLIADSTVIEMDLKSCVLECNLDYAQPGWANGYSSAQLGKKMSLITFQVSIRSVPMTALTAIHFKRISGSSWNYKKVCSKLLQQLED